MKTFKIVIATIAFSMLGVGLGAQELPPQAQEQIEQAERLSKGKAKQRRAQNKGDKADEHKADEQQSDEQKADREKAGKQKADKGKAGKQKSEHATKGRSDKSDVRGDGAADGTDSARPSPKEDRSAKGLTNAEKEQRKRLFRLAKIDRIQSIARTNNNDKLLSKSIMLREKENRRHLRVLNRKAGQVDKPETARD